MQYIHIKTREEYNQLMNIFEKKGWKWDNGESIKEFDGYDEYRTDTIISNEDEIVYASIKSGLTNNRHIISFQEYLKQEGLDKPTFTKGEKVLVSIMGIDWYERIYITEIEGARYPYVCTHIGEEDKFLKGELFITSDWAYIKKIELPKTVTLTLSVEDHEKIKELLNI